MNIFRYLILAVLVVGISACIQLRGTAPPAQYFVLESIVTSPGIYSGKDLRIGIELVEFPEYLKRPQIVVQRQANIIHFSDNHRWATPLEGQVLSLLTSNLRLLLPQATISISPWHNSRHVDHKLQLSVIKLSGLWGHQSTIDIHWHIVGKNGEKRSGHYIDQRSIDTSYEDLVRALNLGLEGLSKELAIALASE
jgi:uncharacterized lipoprotein YmbA